jgi:tetratricopeptide (TPR) repeat protein
MLSVDEHIVQAASFHDQGKLDEAISMLEVAKTLEANKPEIHFNLGLYYGLIGDPSRASECFAEAVRCRHDWVDAHIYMIAYTIQAGNSEKAIGMLDEAFKLSPDNKMLHEQLAIALASRATAPGADRVPSELEKANDLESQGDYLGAAALCEKALNGTELPDHYLTLARSYFNLACKGNEIYAWKALLAAIEGIDRRAKEQGQPDIEFAVGIVQWVLDQFADGYRLDVVPSYRNSWSRDKENGLEPNTTMLKKHDEMRELHQHSDPRKFVNVLFEISPLVIRPGRSGGNVERESRFAFASQFGRLPDSSIEEFLHGEGFPVPGGYDHQQYDKYLFTSSRVELKRLQARARGIPSILVTCLPKSGSEYLCYTLSDVLTAPVVRATIGSPFGGRIFDEWVVEIARGGCVLHDHFNGRAENIKALKQSDIKRISVLIRDPRAIAWSLHNMANEFGNNETPIEEFAIAVKGFSEWIESWIVAAEHGLSVNFIRFSDLISKPLEVMGDVLKMAGAEAFQEKLSIKLAIGERGSNFRKGDDNAWRTSISESLAAEAWDGISQQVRDLLDLKR